MQPISPPAPRALDPADPSALEQLLVEVDLPHLLLSLRNEQLRTLWLRSIDRPSFLSYLKALGVVNLNERQKLASKVHATLRAYERTRPPAAGVAGPRDEQLPVTVLPALRPTLGVLYRPDGTTYLNARPPMLWLTSSVLLEGAVVALLSEFAHLTGRPVLVPFVDEDLFIAEPHSAYEGEARGHGAWEQLAAEGKAGRGAQPPPAAAGFDTGAPLGSDVRSMESKVQLLRAFGQALPDAAVLSPALLRGRPSAPFVHLMPAFDSWASGNVRTRPALAVAHRRPCCTACARAASSAPPRAAPARA
eukprot:979442-Prymnesium_polylepis.1